MWRTLTGRGVFFSILLFLAMSGLSHASPEFAISTNESCTFCHGDDAPYLNRAGEYYKEYNSLDGYVPHFSENCQSCHTDKRDEWEASRHASSYESSAFKNGISNLTGEQKEECRLCHTTKVGETIIKSVSCVACHNDPKTVEIDNPVEACRRCHSKINDVTNGSRGKATSSMNNEFERWSFGKHSNATGRLLESAEFNALETNFQRSLCLSCHSTDFRVVKRKIKIVDGDIGCVACHGGINPRDEIKKVEGGVFDNYADARRNSLKNINHTYTIPSPDICGNCHSGNHHPQYAVWKTGEHASVACVKCHGETVSKKTHELDMDHTFMVNYESCGECHDATTRLENWQSLVDLEGQAFNSFHKSEGKLDVALELGVSKVYVGEAQRNLDEALEQFGIARNAYFHNQKQMRVALVNATSLSKESNVIIENAILDFKTMMRTIAVVTTVLSVGAVVVIIILVNMWQRNHRLMLPLKRHVEKIRNIKSLPPMEKRLYIFGIIATVSAALLFNAGFAWYSNQPSFCVNCHIMEPMYKTWENGPHSDVDCHTCHVETRIQSVMKGFNYASVLVYGRYAATGVPKVPKEICKKCHTLKKLKPEYLISKDAHMIHPLYFDCNTCHKTHLVTVKEETCTSCHVPGYDRIT